MITLVQTTSGISLTSILTLTLPLAPRPGNLIVVGATTPTGVYSVNNVIDGQGNIYRPTPALNTSCSVFALTPVPANASQAVMLTTPPASNFVTGFAAEFNNAGASLYFNSDAAAQSLGTSINQPVYNSVTTAEQLLFCVCNFSSNLTRAGPPWAGVGAPQGSGSTGSWAEYQIVTAAGSFPASFTGDVTAAWHTLLAAFSASPVPPGQQIAQPTPGLAPGVNVSTQFARDTVTYIGGVVETTRRNPS
jgi:hypothetical protein